MSIQENVMLVRWTICSWGATKRDQQETEETCRNKGTTKEWLRVNKSLLPENALKPIHQVEREARDCHYRMTLPFDDDGWRILPSAMYPEYQKKFEELKAKDYEMVEVLCDDLPRLKEEAKKGLNGAYCEEDYPTAEELWERFDMTMTVRPLPQGENLNLNINSEELARLQKTIDAEVMDQIKVSVNDLWFRLRDVVQYAADRLGDVEAKLYESLVGNIKSLLEVLPKLNITGDKDLAVVTQQVQQNLATLDIESLRKNKRARSVAAQAAQETLKKIDCVMGTRKIDLDLE